MQGAPPATRAIIEADAIIALGACKLSDRFETLGTTSRQGRLMSSHESDVRPERPSACPDTGIAVPSCSGCGRGLTFRSFARN